MLTVTNKRLEPTLSLLVLIFISVALPLSLVVILQVTLSELSHRFYISVLLKLLIIFSKISISENEQLVPATLLLTTSLVHSMRLKSLWSARVLLLLAIGVFGKQNIPSQTQRSVSISRRLLMVLFLLLMSM